jgi:hypothetical protein
MLLVLLLARPVLSLAVPGGASRGILVLADRSSSMTLPGRMPGETRADELSRALTQVDRALTETYPLRVRGFSSEIGPDRDLCLLPEERDHRLARAWKGWRQASGAVVLLSTAPPRGPIRWRRRDVSAFGQAVALGAPSPVRIAVSRLRANVERS